MDSYGEETFPNSIAMEALFEERDRLVASHCLDWTDAEKTGSNLGDKINQLRRELLQLMQYDARLLLQLKNLDRSISELKHTFLQAHYFRCCCESDIDSTSGDSVISGSSTETSSLARKDERNSDCQYLKDGKWNIKVASWVEDTDFGNHEETLENNFRALNRISVQARGRQRSRTCGDICGKTDTEYFPDWLKELENRLRSVHVFVGTADCYFRQDFNKPYPTNKMWITESSKTTSFGQDVAKARTDGLYDSIYDDNSVAKWRQYNFLSRDTLLNHLNTQLKFRPRPKLHRPRTFSDAFDVQFDGKSAKIILSESELTERSVKDRIVQDDLPSITITEARDDDHSEKSFDSVTCVSVIERAATESKNAKDSKPAHAPLHQSDSGYEESLEDTGAEFAELVTLPVKRKQEVKHTVRERIDCGTIAGKFKHDEIVSDSDDEIVEGQFVNFKDGLITCRIMSPGLQREIEEQRSHIDLEELEYLIVVDGRIIFKPHAKYLDIDHDESYCIDTLFHELY